MLFDLRSSNFGPENSLLHINGFHLLFLGLQTHGCHTCLVHFYCPVPSCFLSLSLPATSWERPELGNPLFGRIPAASANSSSHALHPHSSRWSLLNRLFLHHVTTRIPYSFRDTDHSYVLQSLHMVAQRFDALCYRVFTSCLLRGRGLLECALFCPTRSFALGGFKLPGHCWRGGEGGYSPDPKCPV